MRRSLLLTLLLPLLAACADAAPEAVLAPEALMARDAAAAGSCVAYAGDATPAAGQGAKLFEARLAGDLTGTLRVLVTHVRVTGSVEHHEGTFVLEREGGAVVFGDGVRGRRLPTGPPAEGRSRYVASGSVTHQAPALGGVPTEAGGTLWLGGNLAPDPTASTLRYRLTLCE